MWVAISAAGVFRTEDAGKTWRPTNHGLQSEGIPDPDAEVGHCVHRLAMHPSRPDTLFMQKHVPPTMGGRVVPKINVYLPDDLAAAVKDAELPVSSICQA